MISWSLPSPVAKQVRLELLMGEDLLVDMQSSAWSSEAKKPFVDFSCQFVPHSPPPLGGLPGSSYRDKVCVAPTLHLCHSKAASYILQLGCLQSPLQEAP